MQRFDDTGCSSRRGDDDVIFCGDSLLAVDTNGRGVGESTLSLKPDG